MYTYRLQCHSEDSIYSDYERVYTLQNMEIINNILDFSNAFRIIHMECLVYGITIYKHGRVGDSDSDTRSHTSQVLVKRVFSVTVEIQAYLFKMKDEIFYDSSDL